jgi:hypothetical protein
MYNKKFITDLEIMKCKPVKIKLIQEKPMLQRNCL